MPFEEYLDQQETKQHQLIQQHYVLYKDSDDIRLHDAPHGLVNVIIGLHDAPRGLVDDTIGLYHAPHCLVDGFSRCAC